MDEVQSDESCDDMDSVSSLGSVDAAKEIYEFESAKKLRRAQLRAFLSNKLKSSSTMARYKHDKLHVDKTEQI